MDFKPACFDKIARLIDKGVRIPNPLTLDIGEEVRLDRISGEKVVIYPGCRIYGEKTLISPGAKIGSRGPSPSTIARLGRRSSRKAAISAGPFFWRARAWASGPR